MNNKHVEILLVDDSPADIELTIHVLRQNQLANEIHVAEDGKEALDFLFCRNAYQGRSFTDPPRVVLLDLKLPKVDGLSVLKAIRGDDRTKAISVVVLTSSKEQKDLVEGYKLGHQYTWLTRFGKLFGGVTGRLALCLLVVFFFPHGLPGANGTVALGNVVIAESQFTFDFGEGEVFQRGIAVEYLCATFDISKV